MFVTRPPSMQLLPNMQILSTACGTSQHRCECCGRRLRSVHIGHAPALSSFLSLPGASSVGRAPIPCLLSALSAYICCTSPCTGITRPPAPCVGYVLCVEAHAHHNRFGGNRSIETAVNPAVAEAVTVGGMRNLLAACERHGITKICFSDSIGSFGHGSPREGASARWLTQHPEHDPGSEYVFRPPPPLASVSPHGLFHIRSG